MYAKLDLAEFDAGSRYRYWIADVSMFPSIRRFGQVLGNTVQSSTILPWVEA